MSRYRRWNELLELLAAAGQLQVEDAAKALGVSAATIRRDFDELAGQQMLTRDAVLDVGLIAAIARAVSVPLVLHGSSGVPDADLAAAVRAGMTKVNIATQLNKVFTDAVRRCLAGDGKLVDPRKYGSAGRDAIAAEVARLLRVLGAGGRE